MILKFKDKFSSVDQEAISFVKGIIIRTVKNTTFLTEIISPFLVCQSKSKLNFPRDHPIRVLIFSKFFPIFHYFSYSVHVSYPCSIVMVLRRQEVLLRHMVVAVSSIQCIQVEEKYYTVILLHLQIFLLTKYAHTRNNRVGIAWRSGISLLRLRKNWLKTCSGPGFPNLCGFFAAPAPQHCNERQTNFLVRELLVSLVIPRQLYSVASAAWL
jgi:hypothetical protein